MSAGLKVRLDVDICIIAYYSDLFGLNEVDEIGFMLILLEFNCVRTLSSDDHRYSSSFVVQACFDHSKLVACVELFIACIHGLVVDVNWVDEFIWSILLV